MKTALCSAVLVAVGLMGVVPMTGCSTSEPGVTNVAGTINATVNGSPEKVTEAAKDTMEDLKLLSVSATSTKVDGTATGRTAQDAVVSISIQTAGENVSEVDIRVGSLGDKALSMKILDGIKARVK